MNSTDIGRTGESIAAKFLSDAGYTILEKNWHDGNLEMMVFDYIAGMSDNFCLDCGNEILRPEHLNESIERSLTGKWFDVVR